MELRPSSGDGRRCNLIYTLVSPKLNDIEDSLVEVLVRCPVVVTASSLFGTACSALRGLSTIGYRFQRPPPTHVRTC